MLEQLAPAAAAAAESVEHLTPAGFLGWLAFATWRIVGALRTKWEEDRKQQLAIANHFAREGARALRMWATTMTRAEPQPPAPLDVERPISVDHSGPIRIGQ